MRSHSTRISSTTAAALALVAAIGCSQTQTTVEQTAGPKMGPAADFDARPTPPVQASTHEAAGELAESQGDPDRAADQYRMALRADPADQQAMYRLGMVLMEGHQAAQAVADWQQYLTATGGSAAAYSDLGFALDLAGRPAEAEAAFRAGLAKDPRSASCHTNYGLMLARQGHLDAAAAQLATVLSAADVQYNLGSVLESQGRATAAAERYRQALALDPDAADAKVRLAGVETQTQTAQ